MPSHKVLQLQEGSDEFMVSLHGLTRWESIGKAENTTLFDAFLLVTTQQLIKNS